MSKQSDRYERLRSPGGTPGGLGTFLIGLVMMVIGGYLLLNQVIVTGHSWTFYGLGPGGAGGFGITLLPLLFGVVLLFANGSSPVAWLVTAAGVIIIFAGIIASLDIFFRPTSLFNTLLMLGLLAGGLGFIVRSLRSG